MRLLGTTPGAALGRASAAVALLGVLLLALLPFAAGTSKAGRPGPAPAPVVAGDSHHVVVAAAPADVAPAPAAAEAQRAPRISAAERRDGLRRLRGTRTVRGALRHALLAGALDEPTHDRMRSIWYRAERTAARLEGRRRAELGAVLDTVRGLARARRLTAQRLAPAMLTVQRNREFWASEPFPAPKRRLTFGRDPVIFQFYAGQGLQIQPLANLGRANALARVCLQARPRFTCRPAALRRLLDRMVDLAVARDGSLQWEHLFAFGGGRPGWVSAMTQATGAQALARGRRALDRPAYGRSARRALRPLGRRPLAVPARGGRRYPMYSFRPALRILNGELQSVIAVHDTASLLGSRSAKQLYRRGERAVRISVRSFDTGAWSRYSAGGAESTLAYHQLVTEFLRGMCTRTGRGAYCATARRFARYEREAPRVAPRVRARTRIRRATPIRFWVSKVSDVKLAVTDRHGVQMVRTLHAARGTHTVGWRPRRSGRARIAIRATGPGGPQATVKRSVVVKRAKPAKGKREPTREPGRAR